MKNNLKNSEEKDHCDQHNPMIALSKLVSYTIHNLIGRDHFGIYNLTTTIMSSGHLHRIL